MFGFMKWKNLYLSVKKRLETIQEEYQSKCTEVLVLKNEVDRLKQSLSTLMDEVANTPPPVQIVKEVKTTIPPDRFDKFVASLPNAQAGNDTSAGALGHKLGVQLVLDKIRREFVV